MEGGIGFQPSGSFCPSAFRIRRLKRTISKLEEYVGVRIKGQVYLCPPGKFLFAETDVYAGVSKALIESQRRLAFFCAVTRFTSMQRFVRYCSISRLKRDNIEGKILDLDVPISDKDTLVAKDVHRHYGKLNDGLFSLEDLRHVRKNKVCPQCSESIKNKWRSLNSFKCECVSKEIHRLGCDSELKLAKYASGFKCICGRKLMEKFLCRWPTLEERKKACLKKHLIEREAELKNKQVLQGCLDGKRRELSDAIKGFMMTCPGRSPYERRGLRPRTVKMLHDHLDKLEEEIR